MNELTPYEYNVIQETQRKAMNFFLPSTASNVDAAGASQLLPSFGLNLDSSSATAGSLISSLGEDS